MLAEKIVQAIANSVQEGVEPGLSPNGILQMQVIGSDRVCEVFLVVHDGETKIGIGTNPNACSSITLDAQLAAAFSRGLLELRDTNVRRRMQMRGDWAFVVSLVNACARPSQHTLDVFSDAAAKSEAKTCYIHEHLGPPTEAVLSDCISAGHPLVVKWQQSFSSWSLEALAAKYGHCMLDIGVSFRTVVARMLAGETVYTHGCKVPEEMAVELSWEFYERKRCGIPQLWMGSRSSRLVTGLHREVSSAFLVQIVGRKKLLLYRPGQQSYVYARRAHGSLQQCWVNPDEWDHTKFPLFSRAEPLEVILGPGEALLIPPAWFHCAYALDDVVSIGTAIY